MSVGTTRPHLGTIKTTFGHGPLQGGLVIECPQSFTTGVHLCLFYGGGQPITYHNSLFVPKKQQTPALRSGHQCQRPPFHNSIINDVSLREGDFEWIYVFTLCDFFFFFQNCILASLCMTPGQQVKDNVVHSVHEYSLKIYHKPGTVGVLGVQR